MTEVKIATNADEWRQRLRLVWTALGFALVVPAFIAVVGVTACLLWVFSSVLSSVTIHPLLLPIASLLASSAIAVAAIITLYRTQFLGPQIAMTCEKVVDVWGVSPAASETQGVGAGVFWASVDLLFRNSGGRSGAVKEFKSTFGPSRAFRSFLLNYWFEAPVSTEHGVREHSLEPFAVRNGEVIWREIKGHFFLRFEGTADDETKRKGGPRRLRQDWVKALAPVDGFYPILGEILIKAKCTGRDGRIKAMDELKVQVRGTEELLIKFRLA